MAKVLTLNQNRDFRRLYHKKSQVSGVVVTYATKNRLGYNRIGITTSKKVGNAVKRNRCRRIIKEAYRLLAPSLCKNCGWDIVFVARVRTADSSTQEVGRHIKKHLSSCIGLA